MQSNAEYAVLRLNVMPGATPGTRLVNIPIDQWRFHPCDDSIDVAVVAIGLSHLPWAVDHILYPISGFVTEEKIRDHEIGVGDELFITGLFSPHYGESSNVPIIRMGNIAVMPEQPIDTGNGPTPAYLIETRSIGGLSGSPVFVNLGLHRWVRGRTVSNPNPPASLFLLGLMHGHFALPSLRDLLPDDPLGRERINMGIGIVVPAVKIAEVLNQESVLEDERRALERARESNLPLMD